MTPAEHTTDFLARAEKAMHEPPPILPVPISDTPPHWIGLPPRPTPETDRHYCLPRNTTESEDYHITFARRLESERDAAAADWSKVIRQRDNAQLGNYLLGKAECLTGRRGIVTLWDIMEKHFKPYAGMIAQDLAHFSMNETMWRHRKEKQKFQQHELDGIHFIAESLLARAQELKLSVSPGKAAFLSFAAKNNFGVTEILSRMRDLRETMVHELCGINFLPLSAEAAVMLSADNPFGVAASRAFLECREDISEACKAYAFERYTACVFHLGRAMERATRRLAKKMKVGNRDDDWQGYLKAINKKIDAMPYGTKREREKRAPYMEAAAFSMNFKEAWRNPTAHPEQTYTKEQAAEVISSANSFFNAAAVKIFKVKTA